MTVGSGVAVSEKRSVSAFSAIDVTGAFDVVVVCQAAEPSVEVRGDDNLVSVLRTEVEGTVLRLFTDQHFSTHLGLQVRVATANVEAVQLNRSGTVVVSEVANERLELRLDGSGRITATGRTKTAIAAVSGSGQITADGLDAEDVEVTLTGSGEAQVRATANLVAVLSGSGRIIYGGHPPTVRKESKGSGSIVPR